MKHQTDKFSKESFRYVNSYLDDAPITDFLKNESIFKHFQPKNVLDVGCGNGNSLQSFLKNFPCNGFGVEPSEEAVELLKKKFQHEERLNFKRASAHSLPFSTDEFDLVWTWSVLHWVGRNEYLQALGELVRVSGNYLMIMDFVAAEDYRTVYHHNKDFFTYKMDFENTVLSTGIMEKVYSRRWWIDPEKPKIEIPLTDEKLLPFKGNIVNYHARKLTVFKKNYDKLQTLSQNDF